MLLLFVIPFFVFVLKTVYSVAPVGKSSLACLDANVFFCLFLQ